MAHSLVAVVFRFIEAVDIRDAEVAWLCRDDAEDDAFEEAEAFDAADPGRLVSPTAVLPSPLRLATPREEGRAGCPAMERSTASAMRSTPWAIDASMSKLEPCVFKQKGVIIMLKQSYKETSLCI